jgi:hypothetical protein
MTDLISTSDLTDYGVVIAAGEVAVVNRLIRSASAAVCNAAGAPIIQSTSTVTLTAFDGQLLRLPGLPIQSVQSVIATADGSVITDWVPVASGLYRRSGWGLSDAPGLDGPMQVTVTYTHGLAIVPADIAELVVSVVIAGLEAFRSENLGLNNGRVSSVGIDDFKEGYATGLDVEAVTPMTLPSRTRRWLAARFGNGSQVVKTL